MLAAQIEARYSLHEPVAPTGSMTEAKLAEEFTWRQEERFV